MSLYRDRDEERLGIGAKELEAVNEALRKTRRAIITGSLHGTANLWFGRVSSLNSAIGSLPERFNAFREMASTKDKAAFSVVQLTRVEPPYVRVEIKREGQQKTEMVSLPLLSLEKAVDRLRSAYETGCLVDEKGFPQHRLTSENTDSVLRMYCPAV